MTFAEKITRVEKTDPDFAKSLKRLRLASWVFGVSVALALAIGVQAFIVNTNQGTTINKYTNSACAKAYPVDGSKPPARAVHECEALRVEIAKGEGIQGPCVLFQRVTGERGTNCPRLFIRP